MLLFKMITVLGGCAVLSVCILCGAHTAGLQAATGVFDFQHSVVYPR